MPRHTNDFGEAFRMPTKKITGLRYSKKELTVRTHTKPYEIYWRNNYPYFCEGLYYYDTDRRIIVLALYHDNLQQDSRQNYFNKMLKARGVKEQDIPSVMDVSDEELEDRNNKSPIAKMWRKYVVDARFRGVGLTLSDADKCLDHLCCCSRHNIDWKKVEQPYSKLYRKAIDEGDVGLLAGCGKRIAFYFNLWKATGKQIEYKRLITAQIVALCFYDRYNGTMSSYINTTNNERVRGDKRDSDSDKFYGLVEKPWGFLPISSDEVQEKITTFVQKLLSANDYVEKPTSISQQLDEKQQEAVRTALSNRLSVINGHAGTGKSSVIAEIAKKKNGSVYVLAPTGKAVENVKGRVVDGIECRTIHSFLHQKQLSSQHIIVDEMSMVDNELFSELCQQCENDKNFRSLVLVGDAKQLPPISWGSNFKGFFAEHWSIPRVTLETIHRGEAADIPKYALAVHGDEKFEEETPNISFPEHIQDLPGVVNENGWENVKVICPTNKHVDEINRRVSVAAWNGRTIQEKDFEDWSVGKKISENSEKHHHWFWKGKRVLNTKNYNKIGIVNGDEGVVEEIYEFEEKATEHGTTKYFGQKSVKTSKSPNRVVVNFNGRQYDFFKFPKRQKCDNIQITLHEPWTVKGKTIYAVNIENDSKISGPLEREDIPKINKLKAAYASTVHKAQGSEYDYVFFVKSRALNMTRSLAYTAMTRAKKKLYIVGNEEVKDDVERHEDLAKRIR